MCLRQGPWRTIGRLKRTRFSSLVGCRRYSTSNCHLTTSSSEQMCDLPTETEQPLHLLCHLILAAHCDCMDGLGESCSHIAAVLLKIEAAVRISYTSSACNDEPRQWNSCFVKKVEAAPVASKQFYKEPEKERLRRSKDTCYASRAEDQPQKCAPVTASSKKGNTCCR